MLTATCSSVNALGKDGGEREGGGTVRRGMQEGLREKWSGDGDDEAAGFLKSCKHEISAAAKRRNVYRTLEYVWQAVPESLLSYGICTSSRFWLFFFFHFVPLSRFQLYQSLRSVLSEIATNKPRMPDTFVVHHLVLLFLRFVSCQTQRQQETTNTNVYSAICQLCIPHTRQ